jgi:ATP-dependent RNA helicase SUPV3L1/SUV3
LTRAHEDYAYRTHYERLTLNLWTGGQCFCFAGSAKEGLVADVETGGEVTVEGQFGKIEGFRFRQDQNASAERTDARRRSGAGGAAIPLRTGSTMHAGHGNRFPEQGGLTGSAAVGKDGERAMTR